MPASRDLLRIANCSGYYGDRASAALEMVSGGPIDVLTGDYLAELTMLILWKDRQRNPDGGYAASFLLHMRDVLGECLSKGIKVVVNAGGLNPAGLASALRGFAAKAGLNPSVAYLDGDDLLPRLDSVPVRHIESGVRLADAGITPVTANAYLGSWGIAAALTAGADVVICGRVSDASLVVGPSRVGIRLGAGRLGPAGRRGRRRAHSRMRRASDRRQLLVLHRNRRPGASRASRSRRWRRTAHA